MPYKIYKTYKILLDEKLKNSTFLVVIVVFLIMLTWIIIPNTQAYSKANIFEIQKQNNKNFQNIIILNWKKYKIYFEELD